MGQMKKVDGRVSFISSAFQGFSAGIRLDIKLFT